MPENPARNLVQGLAWRLLAEAESHPGLIRRSANLSEAPAERSTRAFPAMALLSDPALDIRRYLENLVTIAVGAAHQAEDMLLEVRKANKKARRRLAAVASFGAVGLIVGIAGFIASRSTNVRLAEVRDEVLALESMGQNIASLQQLRKAEEATFARQQAERDALQHQIADLQQQASSLRDQIAHSSRDLEAANIEASKLRRDLPQQATSLHDQVTGAVSGEADKPHKKLEIARTETELSGQHVGGLQLDSKAEQTSSARQGPHGQQTALLPPRPPSPPSFIPASTAVRPIPVLMPEPSASQQLLIARQWLAAGRLDQARRVLAMVQTRMVLQPSEPGQPSLDALAKDIGNAIRWLDMGSNGQAMQALNQALFNARTD